MSGSDIALKWRGEGTERCRRSCELGEECRVPICEEARGVIRLCNGIHRRRSSVVSGVDAL